ncbi:expressed unknown protein [Seminavis robusta]|uniref:Uncharacterized protein n=1 Tax=Seminavis robusta TaxID=568900 RepID=A0A9N8DN87_9STRA|nr:expressed unknown protein [Seminavis robusta]|eukprot:Sro230_g093480.1 n/a (314) ;mRNA; f:78597-79538
MGRTSRYKKIKSCDPFSKTGGSVGNAKSAAYIWGTGDNGSGKPKRKSKTALRLQQQKMARKLRKFKDKGLQQKKRDEWILSSSQQGQMNRPPSDDEDEFDMNDLQGSVRTARLEDTLSSKGEESMETLSGVTRVVNNPLDEMKEAEKLLKQHATTTDQQKQYEGRREGESKNAFSKRVKAETRQIIKQQTLDTLNPEKKKRKKEFLNNKKKRKKRKQQQQQQQSFDNDNDHDDHDIQREDHIPFGHQVERPPTFQSLPRGATTKKKAHNNKDNNKNALNVKAEQANLEQMRLQVQEQYAAIKARRKRGGDFHL